MDKKNIRPLGYSFVVFLMILYIITYLKVDDPKVAAYPKGWANLSVSIMLLIENYLNIRKFSWRNRSKAQRISFITGLLVALYLICHFALVGIEAL